MMFNPCPFSRKRKATTAAANVDKDTGEDDDSWFDALDDIPIALMEGPTTTQTHRDDMIAILQMFAFCGNKWRLRT